MYNKNIELGFKKGNKGNKKSRSLMTPGFLFLQYQIGATGFEPATSRPPAVRATKLRHTPRTVDIVPNVIIKINSFFKKTN